MRSHLHVVLSTIFGLALLVSGCSTSTTSDPQESNEGAADAGAPEQPVADDPVDPEPEPETPDEEETTECPVGADLGTVGMLSGAAVQGLQDGSTDKVYRLQLPLAEGEPSDLLVVELWQGYGAFADAPVTTGDYPLTEADADPVTCGACVFIAGDATDAGVAAFYVANGGVLHVSSVDGELSVSLEAATFAQFDPTNGAPIDAGCTSAITSAFASGAIEILPVETCERRCDTSGALPGEGGEACYCDDECVSKGDCCGGSSAYVAECGDPDESVSCQGWCGYDGALQTPEGHICYCDDICADKGDCCGGAASYEATCE